MTAVVVALPVQAWMPSARTWRRSGPAVSRAPTIRRLLIAKFHPQHTRVWLPSTASADWLPDGTTHCIDFFVQDNVDTTARIDPITAQFDVTSVILAMRQAAERPSHVRDP